MYGMDLYLQTEIHSHDNGAWSTNCIATETFETEMSLMLLLSHCCSRHPLLESQLSSAANQSHSKVSQGKSEYNRHLTMNQQFTSVMTPMLNLTRYQDNRGKNSYSKRPSMEPKFPPEMNSMMNLTHFKNRQEKSSRIFSFSDTDNEISVSATK
jgi:hypothetical protein